jgi:PTH1 family peptidyl-tRNA hydrolase
MGEEEANPESEVRNPDATWLIVGLGNPGSEYAGTYHNVGFRVVERMAAERKVAIRERCGPALISGKIRIGGREAVLVLPQGFMNRSGLALPPLFERFESGPANLVVVVDDVALPVGKLRIRQKGSAGGHNGLKSLVSSCGSDEFLRVRVGIRPELAEDQKLENMRDFVLARVKAQDRACLDRAEVAASQAVEMLLADGVERTMAAFNGIDLREAVKEN